MSKTEGEKSSFKWQVRHTIIDHANKKILIQVMWDNGGYINLEEYRAIKSGYFQQYLPQDLDRISIEIRGQIRELIANNYAVEPIFFQGMQNQNCEFAILQLTPIVDPTLISMPT